MLCVVITGPSFTAARAQICKSAAIADLLEFRLDLFTDETLIHIEVLRSLASASQVLYTLRSQNQGGKGPNGNRRLELIETYLKNPPAYLDVEIHDSLDWVLAIRAACPQMKIIASVHYFTSGFEVVPTALKLLELIPADIYKIAIQAVSIEDTLKLMLLAKKTPLPLALISMGEKGELSRILSPVYGGALTYAAVDEAAAAVPGQMIAETLLQTYRFKTLNIKTQIYGLIGFPTSKSISHHTHNAVFSLLGKNAVYVKVDLVPEELERVLPLLQALGWQGLSVTMPLKASIMDYLDAYDEAVSQIGVANTVVFRANQLLGFNTDGKGALKAIKGKVDPKHKILVILGAGGAASAIGYEALQSSANVIFLNRHPEKALRLAQHYGCKGGDLAELQTYAYDLLINCTPDPMPIPEDWIHPQAIVMDITTNPQKTPFLEAALKKGCQVIYGLEMFAAQAALQFELWGKNTLPTTQMQDFIQELGEAYLTQTP
ncbi:MAG: shikimate dehydrogenase [Parachlamydia sp.]|nr:MAG: shikimate dehydrogenase [Parachlamydia sp.]